MDNPQHYQPLSHALQPPQTQPQSSYASAPVYAAKSADDAGTRREEEEEEEEDEDDDEGLVEEQLSRNEGDGQTSHPSSPHAKAISKTGSQNPPPSGREDQTSQEPDRKRRPGRPRGSKNRKPRSTGSRQETTTFYYQGHSSLHSTSGPPQHPDINAHNQPYYEFQWRVLNLCAEFYVAAEELVKGTSPTVIMQCYQMGPSVKVDPLNMLSEAKRICDTLLANPSQLITNPPPPPPVYSLIPAVYPSIHHQPSSIPPSSAAAAKPAGTLGTAASTSSASVITNAQSFVVPLGTHQAPYSAHPQYSLYAPTTAAASVTTATGHTQYPTTSYYPQYPTYGTYYAAHQPTSSLGVTTTAGSTSSVIQAATGANISSSSTAVGGNQGAWSDEETDRLKKFAEECRTNVTGEIDWDRVVSQWGAGRTRHQILIKATSLGLKESSTRGVKRRREMEGSGSTGPTGGGASDVNSPSTSHTPTLNASSNLTNTATSASNANSSLATAASSASNHRPTANVSGSPAMATASTPVASPALQHTTRPQSQPQQQTTKTTLPWPMPTIAATTPSPVVAAASLGQSGSAGAGPSGNGGDQQRTSYYRPRPTEGSVVAAAAKTGMSSLTTQHQYLYQPQPNGRLGKDSGK